MNRTRKTFIASALAALLAPTVPAESNKKLFGVELHDARGCLYAALANYDHECKPMYRIVTDGFYPCDISNAEFRLHYYRPGIIALESEGIFYQAGNFLDVTTTAPDGTDYIDVCVNHLIETLIPAFVQFRIQDHCIKNLCCDPSVVAYGGKILLACASNLNEEAK